MEYLIIKYLIILVSSLTFLSMTFGLKLKAKDVRLNSGHKCQLQGQYCDLMNPTKQCCPGTSCGIKRSGEHVSNLCVICRDLGQPCNSTRPEQCCGGLSCQMITEFASVCNPKRHRPFLSQIIADKSLKKNKKFEKM